MADKHDKKSAAADVGGRIDTARWLISQAINELTTIPKKHRSEEVRAALQSLSDVYDRTDRKQAEQRAHSG